MRRPGPIAAALAAFAGAAALALALSAMHRPSGARDPAPAPALAGRITALSLEAGLASGSVLPARIEGRVAALAEGGLAHQWPGFAAEARFSGDDLIVALDDAAGRYRLVFADGRAREIEPSGPAAFLVGGLGPGPHTVRLERLTESLGAPAIFRGLRLPPGGRALAPPSAPPRRIAFLGDSDMVGYGVLADGRDCTPEEVRRTSDVTRAYPALVARRLGAEPRLIAHSGIGIVRNYGGATPGSTMPDLHARALIDQPPLAEEAWSADVVVVALGSNDFATELGAHERWPDVAALRADFERAYLAFLAELRRSHADALILLVVMHGYGRDYEDAQARVAAAFAETIDPRVDVLRFPALDQLGCHWHPSLKDHRRMAERLTARLDQETTLW